MILLFSALRPCRYFFGAVIVALSFLTGCSMFYYGYTREEWFSLSEQTRQDVKEEYQRVLETRQAQDHDDVIDSRTDSLVDHGLGKSKQ